MSDDDDLEPREDGMHPPDISTEVFCLHCKQVYESYPIEWRVKTCHDGRRRGFWSCPIPDCDGAGFGFDIFPIDPDYQNDRGIVCCSDEDEAEFDHPASEFGDLPDQTRRHSEKPLGDDSDVPF